MNKGIMRMDQRVAARLLSPDRGMAAWRRLVERLRCPVSTQIAIHHHMAGGMM